jgi:hypothetical protein
VVVAAQVGISPKRPGDAQRPHGVVPAPGELDRGPQVGALGIQRVEFALKLGQALGAALDLRGDAFHQPGKARQVRLPGLLFLAGRGQPLARVLAHDVEQVVARARV